MKRLRSNGSRFDGLITPTLKAAFAGESQTRNKYTYFASKAEKEGLEHIAALFLKTADNEKKHAKMWFKELEGFPELAAKFRMVGEIEKHLEERHRALLKNVEGWLCPSRPAAVTTSAPPAISSEALVRLYSFSTKTALKKGVQRGGDKAGLHIKGKFSTIF